VTTAAWDKGLAAVAAQVAELEALQAERAAHPELALARARMAVASAETALRRTLARIDAAAGREDPGRPFEQALLRLGSRYAATLRRVDEARAHRRIRSLWLDLLVAGQSGAALAVRLAGLEAAEKRLRSRLGALRADRQALSVALENRQASANRCCAPP
jgi:hypothetical protein